MKTFNAMVRVLTVGVLMAVAGQVFAQQSYPSKPIRFIVPYTPGGTTSILARLAGQRLTESWGQTVIVDNRPGGNTIIGSEALVKSAPDGYTMLLAASTLVVLPHLYKNLPYDPIKDFAPVATLASSELVLVLHPSLPLNNLQAFIAFAKSRPGELNHASAGSGGSPHLAGELFNIMAGVQIQHIPYKGSGPLVTDLLGGQVQLAFAVPFAVLSHIKSGRLKAIAVSGESRLPALPQVPTFTEGGLPGFNVTNWYGVLVPAGTPNEIINKLATELARFVAMPDTREKLVSQGVAPFISTPDQFAALLKAELAKFARIIKTANIKLGN